LIFLIRKVMQDFHFKGYTVKAGKYVCASPRVSHRIAEIFPDPEKFDPEALFRNTPGGRQAFQLDCLRRRQTQMYRQRFCHVAIKGNF